MMLGKYDAAIGLYDRALKQHPDWQAATINREIAMARKAALDVSGDPGEGTGGKLGADEIVFDDRAKNSPDAETVERNQGKRWGTMKCAPFGYARCRPNCGFPPSEVFLSVSARQGDERRDSVIQKNHHNVVCWPAYILINRQDHGYTGACPHFLSESAKPNQDGSFWVGQKVPVIVEVLSATHFSGSTRFSLPDIAGAVFYKPEERAIVMSRDIDGVSYSVQRHEFSFYPQRADPFTIPGFSVRFGVAGNLGEPAKEYNKQTQPLPVKAVFPPGAKGLRSLISTTDLKVTRILVAGSTYLK